MQKTRKLLTFIFAIACLMAVATFSSSAATEVDTWDELKVALENPGTANVILTGNISQSVENSFAYVNVNGTKTLDLNGHTIAYYDNVGKNDVDFTSHSNRDTLFNIGSSAELTINDSSVGQTGSIVFDGWLANARKLKVIPIRDMFSIGGKLTVNGGYFSCGHQDDEWVTALTLNGSLYTGYVNKQVYGTPLVLCYGGELVVNGGGFVGRGGSYIKDKTNGTNYEAAAVFCSYGSNTTINGGSFLAMGGADVFCADHRAEITVKSGTFKSRGIDKAIIRNDSYDAGNISDGYMHIRSDMIADGIEKKVIIADGNVYTYAAGAEPTTFDWSTTDVVIYDVIGFKSQSPVMPEGKTLEHLGECNVNYNKIISFEEKPLDSYLKNLGISMQSSLVVRNSSTTVVYSTPESGPKAYNLKNVAPDTYTITEQITLTYAGKVISKYENTFIVAMKNFCSHTYTTISDTATCLVSGTKTERCTKCGEEKISVSLPLGHLSLSSDWAYNSTHHWYYCRRCNTILTKDAHSYISSTNRTCKYCGYNDNCEWGNAMDTEYDEKYHWWPCDTHSLDDTCPNNHQLEKELHTVCTLENAGSLEHAPEIEYSCQNGYVCDGCGEYFGETGEHKWEQIPAREGGIKVATCTVSGYIKYRCYYNGKYDCKGNKITCSAIKTVTIPALGHDYDYSNPESNTATCTEDGLYTYKCTRARCYVTTSVISPAQGHNLVDWIVTTPASCTTDGISTATCSNTGCNYSTTMPISAIGHSFGTTETVQQPTCTSAGKNVAKCTFDGCNETQEEVLPALEHSMIKHGLVPATMSADGTCEYYECELCHNTFLDPDGYQESPIIKIAKIKSVTLSATKYLYDGKNKTPSLTVKDSKGNKLIKGTDYTISVVSTRKAVGKYTVTVKFKCNYSGEKKLYFYILPNKTTKVTTTQNTSAIMTKWAKVTGADGYAVAIYDANGKKLNTKYTTALQLKYSALKAATVYKIKVTAYKVIDGNKVYSTAYSVITTATAPAKPTLKATSPSKGKLTLTWSNVSGETGYVIQYSTKKTSGFKKLTDTKANVVSYSKKVTSGKTYYFRVKSYKKVGDTYIYSAWSDVKGVKIK